MAQKFHDLKVAQVTRETPQCVAIELEIPQDKSVQFHYKNGQYVTIEKEIDGNKVRRSYSICSAHQNKEAFTIAVKEVTGGTLSPVLNQKLNTGDVLHVSEPEGNFTLPVLSPAAELFFYAGGSGITPILSLIKQALYDSKATVRLLYANTEDSQVIFLDQLTELQQAFQDRFTVQHFIEADNSTIKDAIQGRIPNTYIHNLPLENNGVQHHFICGPGPLMEHVKANLEQQQVAGANIHLEYFEAPEEDLPDTGEFKGTAEVTIILDGEETKLSVGEDDSILSAMLEAGMDAPYSCQSGVCATCRALVSEGEVYLSQNLGITDGEIKEGYTLTCSSYPRSKNILVNFDEA